MTYIVATEGLEALDDLADLDEVIVQKARMAVNKTADWSRTRGSEAIRSEVALSASYLNGVDGRGRQRLGVSKRATDGSLEAAITGRFEPTSLARFVVGSKTPNRRGPSIMVEPGKVRKPNTQRTFLMRLRSGNSGDLGNLGLAIRLKPGERVRRKKEQILKEIGKGLYLLYGPSVDQVFRAVADQIAPDSGEYLEREFLRLMKLELNQ